MAREQRRVLERKYVQEGTSAQRRWESSSSTDEGVQSANERLRQQLHDYASVGARLFWQRQAIFAAALLMAGFFYSATLAVTILLLTIFNEVFDTISFKKILADPIVSKKAAKQHHRRVIVGTITSAGTICLYALWISELQGETSHFMPLFFLFAAGIFAAMNNHQIKSALVIRLLFYGATFLFIPIDDITSSWGEVSTDAWVQFFSSIFVAFFILDCSRVFLNMYRDKLDRIEELSDKNRRIEASLQAKSTFLSTMSHELRTPLTSVSAALELLQDNRLSSPETATKLFEISRRNCATLLHLISEILDFQKMESHELVFSKRTINLNDVVMNSVEANRLYVEKYKSKILTSLPAEAIFVYGDEKRLQQVYANVISNAAKFSPAHSDILVSLNAECEKAVVRVRDHGVGIDSENSIKVFEPFTQIDGGDDRAVGGTGLGLSIAKRIVEGHDGNIGFEDNSGPGVTFWISMPIVSSSPNSIDQTNMDQSAA